MSNKEYCLYRQPAGWSNNNVSTCGAKFWPSDGYKFCPICGKKLKEQPKMISIPLENVISMIEEGYAEGRRDRDNNPLISVAWEHSKAKTYVDALKKVEGS